MTMSTVAAPPAKDTYTPLELFGIDRLLDEDERDIAATVRRFVETRLKPNVEDWFESATLPKELAKEFGGTDGHKYVNAVLNGLAPRLRAAEVASDKSAEKADRKSVV
mgnify:CR=1 FL=1